MSNKPHQRRLAAIVAADVVGYSRLMEFDEAGTLARLKARRRDIFDPLVARYEGRLVKVMGDGVLVEFRSAVSAVQCAVDLQAAFASSNQSVPETERIVLRIGINLGDVIVEGSDLYGDGVNVATRLEKLASAGGICISQSVHEQVKRKTDFGFDELGLKEFKNISEPVLVFAVRPRRDEAPKDRLALPAKPSIAVLPFTNMGNESEQEAFVDGLTEDLITDLSRHAGLFVIARNSTFAYKGRSVDARRIAGDLGVRYLLEGSARRSADRVRINAQLIDAVDGAHLWADRFDRDLKDVFAVQDEVVAKIVEALVGRLTNPPALSRPKSIEAYDLCVRARVLHEQSPQAAQEAFLLLQRAIALDPNYAEALAWLALNHWLSWVHWGQPVEPNRRLALEVIEKAVSLDPNHATCRWILGMVLAYDGRWAESDEQYALALKMDPNHADAWADLSDISVMKGEIDGALDQIQKAFRLNPYPALWYYLLLGQAQYAARQYLRGIETLRREETYRTGSRRILSACLAQAGRVDEARREAELFMIGNPHFTIRHWVEAHPFRDQATLDHFIHGYHLAGLPD